MVEQQESDLQEARRGYGSASGRDVFESVKIRFESVCHPNLNINSLNDESVGDS